MQIVKIQFIQKVIPMKSRRKFLQLLAWFTMSINLVLNPCLSFVRMVYAKTRKILLPKGTKMNTLVSRNPRLLDTRNLEITPLEEFDTMGITDHEADLTKWRLDITGNIKEPCRLSYSEVVALPSIERNVLLICPGIFAYHAKWKGIQMKYLLEKVKMEEGITHLTFSGPIGRYEKVERFPLENVLSNQVFLVYAVNGESLPQKHGYPLRVVAEGYYGDFWVKYVYKMKVERINT